MVRLLDLKPGKEDNEAAMSLSSSQELCPVVYTGPDASLLLDCGYASEGPSKATQSPFLPESPVGLPERAGVDQGHLLVFLLLQPRARGWRRKCSETEWM